MKIKVLLFFLILGMQSVVASSLEAYFMYNTYHSPNGPYIETYISTIGNSAVFVKNDNAKFQAEVEITIIFYKNNEVFTYTKQNLKSPEVNDSLQGKPNFLDVQRIPLENGIYNLQIIIKDVNSPGDTYNYSDIISMSYGSEAFGFSSIQFIESFEASQDTSVLIKHGYKMIPYISDFYPQNTDRLIFYTELYNSQLLTPEAFLVSYYITRFDNNEVLDQFSRFKKMEPKEFNVLLGEINISELYSGNYYLCIDVKNKSNEVLATRKIFFQRSKNAPGATANGGQTQDIYFNFNGINNNADTLRFYTASLRPLANTNECNFIDFQLKNADLETMKNFFSGFWTKRSPADPNGEWMIYKAQVDFVNKWYSTPISRGFETDRGRVYLKYGTPNDIYVSKHEPSAYPYEIWQYYKIGVENNRKFVFYNPNLAGEEYQLLHSDVTGELRFPNWERFLNNRNNSMYNFDQRNSDDHWGGRAIEEYNK